MEWIDVNERLPEEDVKVMVCCCTKKGIQNINLAYQTRGIWHGSGSMSGVTHWMPLPEPPNTHISKVKHDSLCETETYKTEGQYDKN